MLIDFFLHLKENRLPVSIKEFLALLEALQQHVIEHSLDDFYVPLACDSGQGRDALRQVRSRLR
jgi:uncharacterized protein with von Willebrand factor type A (vWA) domain